MNESDWEVSRVLGLEDKYWESQWLIGYYSDTEFNQRAHWLAVQAREANE